MISNRLFQAYHLKNKMSKVLLYFVQTFFYFLSIVSQAQNFEISFETSGEISSLDSIVVENLNQNTKIVIEGDDILHLVGTVNSSNKELSDFFIKCMPNPIVGQAVLEFYSNNDGEVSINVYDLIGRNVVRNVSKCSQGIQRYYISGLQSGYYVLQVSGASFDYKLMILSNKNIREELSIERVDTDKSLNNFYLLSNSKNLINKNIISMDYNIGDLMKYTGYYRMHSSIINDIPDQSKTMTFTFEDAALLEVFITQWTSSTLTSVNFMTYVRYSTQYTGIELPLYRRGICWTDDTTTDILDYNLIEDLNTNLNTSLSTISGLECNSEYYVRAYAENAYGLKYSDELQFRTLSGIVVIETCFSSQISITSALLNGKVFNNGGISPISYGFYWSTDTVPTLSDSVRVFLNPNSENFIDFNSMVYGLIPNTKYYVRTFAVLVNLDTIYGNVLSFRTLDPTINILTSNVNSITFNSAISGGSLLIAGPLPITSKGLCWSILPEPTINDSVLLVGSGVGSFVGEINNLNINTVYYLRAFAINEMGVFYGNEIVFITPCRVCPDTIMDGNGNVYSSVLIGTQCWLNKNLSATKFNDSTSISHIVSSQDWNNIDVPAYCWYNNDSIAYSSDYGPLYNGYAVDYNLNGNRNICPKSWHVPSMNEWQFLYNTTGGSSVAGGKLKEIGTLHWLSPNTAATDEFGFTALPGGTRNYGSFMLINQRAYFWSSSIDIDDFGYNPYDVWFLYNCNGTMGGIPSIKTGNSVRCTWDYCTTLPTVANAGADTVIQYSNEVTLNANVPIFGQGHWKIVSGLCGRIEDTLNNSTLFAGRYGSNYKLVWTITSPCGEISTDTIQINILSYYFDCGDVLDVDSNYYSTVQVGNQCWLGQNLKTTKFNDNTIIPYVSNSTEWSNLSTPAYSFYNNDVENINVYGLLYNGFVVDTLSNGNKNICPNGWRVPSHDDYYELFDYVCGKSVAAAKLKYSGTMYWQNNSVNTINEFWFSALPGGKISNAGYFDSLRNTGIWWSSTKIGNNQEYIVMNGFMDEVIVYSEFDFRSGKSIRCIKE